jgi:hypothetical protein
MTYGFNMEFFAAIVKADSKFNTKGRNPIITLAKAETDGEYWPRLTKDKVKNSRITVDWNKWVDEDEEDEAPAMGGDFDPSMMNAFGGGAGGGMPGMGGGMPPGMEGMMGGMGGMGGGMPPGMEGMMGGMGGAGGMGGMDMEALMKQMGGMGGMGGAAGMPDSDDEDEEQEAEGEPKKDDGLGDLDAAAEK